MASIDIVMSNHDTRKQRAQACIASRFLRIQGGFNEKMLIFSEYTRPLFGILS